MNIVTANGKILTVNNRTNSDLYFALRGGGSSFGIVKKFVLTVNQIPPVVFLGTLYYDDVNSPQVFNAWQIYLASNLPPEVFTQLLVNSGNISVSLMDSSGKSTNFNAFKKKFPTANSLV